MTASLDCPHLQSCSTPGFCFITLGALGLLLHTIPASFVLTVERLSSGVLAFSTTSPPPSVAHCGNGIAGRGDLQNRNKPGEIELLWPLGVIQIAAGDNHSAALTADGRVFTWGRGKYGQLGLGSFETSSTPQHVKLPIDIVQASCICLFLGTAWCFPNHRMRPPLCILRCLGAA